MTRNRTKSTRRFADAAALLALIGIFAMFDAPTGVAFAQDQPPESQPEQEQPQPEPDADAESDDSKPEAMEDDDGTADETAVNDEVQVDGAVEQANNPADAAARDLQANDKAASHDEVDPPAAVEQARQPKDPKSYGLWVLVPAILAIILAIVTRQVIPALVVAIFLASYMLLPCLAVGDPYAQGGALVSGFRLAAEKFVLGAVTNSENDFAQIKIIVFTLVIGFMVGVIGRNGGTRGMVQLVAGDTNSPRRGALTAWLAGLVVFFDDYANSMIVGPTMRSVFDRLKLSRAKLAYIVDSTAAPVASIALIGTWVGAEIGFIQTGLDDIAASGSALLDNQGNVITGMQAFISSIPYRFYPILALFLVFLIALTGRDFGPMKRSERKVFSQTAPDTKVNSTADGASLEAPPRWWLGFVPVILLVFMTMTVLVAGGARAEGTIEKMNAVAADGSSLWAQMAWWERASVVISNADSYMSIFYGAIVAAIAAVILTLIFRVCSTRDAVDAGVDGMARMFPAVVILVLAWALSAALQGLALGEVVGDKLQALNFQAHWFPLAVFLCAAVVSFSTGTSWGTMGILCPMVVVIAARLIGDVESSEAMPLFYASVGSVLAGAIFGDHCSPISDTTVLSSIATGCRHEEHVWTQLPYAMVAAVASMALGDVACSVYGKPWYVGLSAGALLLVLVVFIFGRKPVADYELAEA